MSNLRTGGQILVDQLKIHGADLAFCVPGESYLAVLDALYDGRDQIRLITCRHEAGAANMAEAYGKLTGKPGICFVTRGPGATHASIGLHTAFQDSTPMILFIGQVARDQTEREAFQEIDYRRMLGPLTKWVAEVPSADRLPEFISRAFHTAVSGRPGPVALALPEDMLTERMAAVDSRPYQRVEAAPRAEDMARLAEILSSAERPIAVLGGGGWTAKACDEVRRFLEVWNLPAVTSFRGKDRLDNRHSLYAGDMGIGIDPKLGARIAQADVLVVIGPRLGEMTTNGYTRVVPPVPAQRLVHVFPAAEELNRVYQAELGIVSGIEAFAKAAAVTKPPAVIRWREWAKTARADYEAFVKPVAVVGDVNPSEIFAWLNERLPEDAILTNGAGNYAGWLHRFHLHRRFNTQLAPTSGAMGYGVPAAIGAKAVHPDRIVIGCAGDGCFLMNGQELATAAQYGLNVIILVFNNGMYGTIRMHQEREYPARVVGTDLVNPDFAAYAKAFGFWSATVRATDAFKPAFEAALASGKPALIEIITPPDAISPTATLSGIRKAAQTK
ncbi:MAG: thiamine pyrophosphate-binding protein [Alphaproteobacteria bacterium]|nr:thiamine pyrophosphate-binding protein [Alphaproteobacteria bacterium]